MDGLGKLSRVKKNTVPLVIFRVIDNDNVHRMHSHKMLPPYEKTVPTFQVSP